MCVCIFSFLKRHCTIIRTCLAFFTRLFLTLFLPGHYVAISANVLYFPSSITRVSIPWTGVHSKMPTTVPSCSNVCNDGRSTSSSRPTCSTAKSRSRLVWRKKKRRDAGIPGMDEDTPSCWNFPTNSHDSTRIMIISYYIFLNFSLLFLPLLFQLYYSRSYQVYIYIYNTNKIDNKIRVNSWIRIFSIENYNQQLQQGIIVTFVFPTSRNLFNSILI